MEAPPLTLVNSPDFLSTPTIDHGRGFGSGLGLAPIPIAVLALVSSPDVTI